VAMLEVARKKLRALVKLMEKGQRVVVYTDFEDELGKGAMVELPDVGTGTNLAKFRDKARQFLKAHESHLSLHRLRRNQPLTLSDLQELGRMLVDAGGSQEVIQQATEQSQGLGIFIRLLVGLDRETASQAFSQFVIGTTATASQLEFIHLIVQYLTENGVMDAARLYESPFTDISQQGPEVMFLPVRVTESGAGRNTRAGGGVTPEPYRFVEVTHFHFTLQRVELAFRLCTRKFMTLGDGAGLDGSVPKSTLWSVDVLKNITNIPF